MDRQITIKGFAAAALTLLATYTIGRYGYDTVKGLLILAGLAAIGALAIDPATTAGIAGALVLYYVCNRLFADTSVSVWVVAVAALVVLLATRGGSIRRK